MLDMLGVKEKKKKVEKSYDNEKPLTMFDYITDICANKKGNIHLTRDPNLSKFNPFMIMRYLCLDKHNITILSIVNRYHSCLSKEELYKTLIILINSGKKFLRYPRLLKNMENDEDIDLIRKYFICSKGEAKEFIKLGLLTKKDIEIISLKFGGREK